MAPPTRRRLLCGTAGLVALTAGCIADETATEPGSPNGTDDGPGAGDDDDDGTDEDDPEDADATDESESDDGTDEDETLPAHDARAFQKPGRTSAPVVERHDDRDDVEEWLADRNLEGAEDLAAFVDETSFDAAALISLEAGGNDPSYELALEDVLIEEDRVSIDAAVRDARPDEENAMVVVTVGQLVRVESADDPPSEVRATIVDGAGEEHDLEVSGDEERASSYSSG